MASITSIVAAIKDDLDAVLSKTFIEQCVRDSGHTWRNRQLDAVTTVQLFIQQILHGNIACREVRHLPEEEEALGIGAAEFLGHVVVVGAHAGPVEVPVLVAHEVVHGPLARVDELGVDAVEVHVVEPGLAVPAALADGVVGVPLPLHLLEAHAGRRHEADVHEGGALLELPGVAALVVLHELRRPVSEGLGEPALPDVRGLDGVAVGVDQSVLAHGDLPGRRGLEADPII